MDSLDREEETSRNGSKDLVKAKLDLAMCLFRANEGHEEKAVKLLEYCAEAGDMDAMWMLGLCLEYGIGVENDDDNAKSLYDSSSRMGCQIGNILKKNNSTYGPRNGVIEFSG